MWHFEGAVPRTGSASWLEDVNLWVESIGKQTKKGEKNTDAGWLSGRRQGPQGLPRILQEAGPSRVPAEGQEDEKGIPGILAGIPQLGV